MDLAKTASKSDWALEQTAKTRRQLILAGMRLMAKRGFDGVSMRSVNVAAGAKNSSAAHYHFGSKQGLVEAIVDTLSEDVSRVRRPLLEALSKRASANRPSAREIIEAGYLPFFGLLHHRDYGMPAIKFLSRLIVDTTPEMRVIVNRFTTPLAEEMFELLNETLPEIPPTLLKSRILFSLNNLINGPSDSASMVYSALGDMSYDNRYEQAHHFLDYIVAGISAPPSPMEDHFVELCDDLIAKFQDQGD